MTALILYKGHTVPSLGTGGAPLACNTTGAPPNGSAARHALVKSALAECGLYVGTMALETITTGYRVWRHDRAIVRCMRDRQPLQVNRWYELPAGSFGYYWHWMPHAASVA